MTARVINTNIFIKPLNHTRRS